MNPIVVHEASQINSAASQINSAVLNPTHIVNTMYV